MSAGRLQKTATLLGLVALAAAALVGCPNPGSGDSATLSTILVQYASATITSFNFGVGFVTVSGAPVLFTIINDGSTTVDLGGPGAIQITGTDAADFMVTSAPTGSLGGGQSATFGMAFCPTATGTRTATVKIAPASGGKEASLSVVGTADSLLVVTQGGTPVTSSDFGIATVGSDSSPVTYTIRNKSSSSIDLANIAIGGADHDDFLASATAGTTLAAQATTTFTVTFRPTYYGSRTATVTASATSGAATQYTFTVNGTGSSGTIGVIAGTNPVSNGDTLDFGKIWASQPEESFTIDNTGTTALFPSVSVTSASGRFTVTTPAPSQIDADHSGGFVITVDFRNGASHGIYTATVTIQSSDAYHPTFTYYLTMDYEGL